MMGLSGRAIAGIAVATVGVAGVGTLLALQHAKSDTKPDAAPDGTRWKGSEGFLKEQTFVDGSRDASSGAWKLNVNGFDKYSVAGSSTEDGFRAAVEVARHSENRQITATKDASGTVTGMVTTTHGELDDSGSRFNTTLVKHRFETKGAGAGSWSGEVLHADGDEKTLISGTASNGAWTVTIDRPENPYIPHEEFNGKGTISLDEHIALAVSEATT